MMTPQEYARALHEIMTRPDPSENPETIARLKQRMREHDKLDYLDRRLDCETGQGRLILEARKRGEPIEVYGLAIRQRVREYGRRIVREANVHLDIHSFLRLRLGPKRRRA